MVLTPRSWSSHSGDPSRVKILGPHGQEGTGSVCSPCPHRYPQTVHSCNTLSFSTPPTVPFTPYHTSLLSSLPFIFVSLWGFLPFTSSTTSFLSPTEGDPYDPSVTRLSFGPDLSGGLDRTRRSVHIPGFFSDRKVERVVPITNCPRFHPKSVLSTGVGKRRKGTREQEGESTGWEVSEEGVWRVGEDSGRTSWEVYREGQRWSVTRRKRRRVVSPPVETPLGFRL